MKDEKAELITQEHIDALKKENKKVLEDAFYLDIIGVPYGIHCNEEGKLRIVNLDEIVKLENQK